MNEQKPTFKEAMQASMIWCKSWENDEISDEVISDPVSYTHLTLPTTPYV